MRRVLRPGGRLVIGGLWVRWVEPHPLALLAGLLRPARAGADRRFHGPDDRARPGSPELRADRRARGRGLSDCHASWLSHRRRPRARRRCGTLLADTRMTGSGGIVVGETGVRFVNGPTPVRAYANAQVDDTTGRARDQYRWYPPLCLSLQARFSHSQEELTGTAGFGFWNDPFMMSGARRPALPQALWFFYSAPPSDMPLAMGVPGTGWKAATLDARRWPFLALAPTAPLGVLLMRSRTWYRTLWPVAQRAAGDRRSDRRRRPAGMASL